jgi:hypothetical protein
MREFAIAVFGAAAWVAWLIFNTVRLYLLARSQAAAQDKLLLRVSSPECLQVFLASPDGAEFLRGLERSPNEVNFLDHPRGGRRVGHRRGGSGITCHRNGLEC